MTAAAVPVPVGESAATIDLLLRDRERMLARIDAGDLAPVLRTMLATIVVAMAVVGAALGSYRGGVQIGYAAIKLPLVLLGTAVLSAPALTAIAAALGRAPRFGRDLAIVMSALAFGALLLAACTPLVLLGRAMDLSYHRMILAVVAMFTVAGIASLRMIVRAVAGDVSSVRIAAVGGFCVVFALVGAQLAWALRPYLVRPRAPEAPFVRALEGSLFDSVSGAFRSARGIYHREEAPVPR